MKRKDIPRFIAALARLRETAPDETALESVFAYPEWKTETEYTRDERIRCGELLYRCVQPHTSQESWTPDVTPALWARVSVEEWPEWIQPYGAEDAYKLGDKVSHNNKHWVSNANGNVWEPGIYGWTEVV